MDDKKKKIIDKTLTIAGIVLCVILIPILIMNVTLIIKTIKGTVFPIPGTSWSFV